MEIARANLAANYVMKSVPKSAPDSLAEDIENSQFKAGAYLFRVEKNGSIKYATNKFILTGANFALKERVQLTEAFNSSNISFFDESVRVYTFNGVATDYFSSDADISKYFAQSSIIMGYNDLFRGSKLFADEAVCVLRFMNHTIHCYPYALSVSYSSSADKMAQFQLTVVVVSHDLEWAGVVNNTQLKDLISINPDSRYLKLIYQIQDIIYLNNDELQKEIKLFGLPSRLESIMNLIDAISDAAYDALKLMIANLLETIASYLLLEPDGSQVTNEITNIFGDINKIPEQEYLSQSTLINIHKLGFRLSAAFAQLAESKNNIS